MGDSSRQELGVSLRADGWLWKPALGFNSLMQIPDKIQSSLNVHLGRFLKKDGAGRGTGAVMISSKQSCAGAASAEVSLDRQLQAWRDNPSWTDEPPEIKVSVLEGSLCNLNLKFKAGLPPDAVYNIMTDPENQKVFKNIKKVISRNVLLDEGSRQIIEVEQAAMWKFLWWSGVLSVHFLVDQNRKNHTVKFMQGQTSLMKKFEGRWMIEPLFVDKEICLPLDPCTLEEYESFSGGRGRVGSAITIDQLIEPSLLAPPPILWCLRGVTTRTTEMMVNDLIAETARLRGISDNADYKQDAEEMHDANQSHPARVCGDIKERWRQRRKRRRHGNSLRLKTPTVSFPSRPSTPKAAMSGQRPPSSLPPQREPFRFWLPYRSNVGSWRQQPRPPSPASWQTPSSPRPQPPTPPPPTPAGPAPRASLAHAVEEDIPLQAESSDESSTIPVQSSDSSQLHGGRPSTADLELTLSGAPAPPTGQEQRPGTGRVESNRGNDTKIAISGFPRSRLFEGARAPYRREIEDGLKSLAAREAPAPRPESSGQGYRVITLAGHNVGASMVLGSGGGPADAPAPSPGTRPPAAAVAANVNSNVQSVNNSSMEESTCTAGNPGVHVDIKNAREEPAAATPTPTPTTREEDEPKEPVRRPPLVVTPEKKTAAGGGGGETAAPTGRRPRRCLRALMMESGSDTEAERKRRPGACRFQCVTDHAPTATPSKNGGAGDKNADDGGKSSTEVAS
ncbi:hypothetical protein U9M48_009449 [Paspalum notatum var. saurae]|uniref:DUF220 domain-containing protein n=2 Tax=Paspalum notatum var. saurae TaxID=547442 RepID=A0AAQ3WEU3_PASNO